MELDKEQLQIELRYAQRFCQRSVRFYRRIQTTFTFISLLAGSSAIAAIAALHQRAGIKYTAGSRSCSL